MKKIFFEYLHFNAPDRLFDLNLSVRMWPYPLLGSCDLLSLEFGRYRYCYLKVLSVDTDQFITKMASADKI